MHNGPYSRCSDLEGGFLIKTKVLKQIKIKVRDGLWLHLCEGHDTDLTRKLETKGDTEEGSCSTWLLQKQPVTQTMEAVPVQEEMGREAGCRGPCILVWAVRSPNILRVPLSILSKKSQLPKRKTKEWF